MDESAYNDRLRELEAENRRLRAELMAVRQQAKTTTHLVEQGVLCAGSDWQQTFDGVPDLIALIDPHHRIVRVNRSMADRLGRTPEECVGQPCYRCVHGSDAPPGECPHSRSIADGREHVVEVLEERLGGTFQVTCTPLFDGHGRHVGSVHVARDISARKRAEEALRESEADLKRAQAVAHIGSWRVDVRSGELSWSDECYRIFGISPGSPLTYEGFLAAVHPDDRQHVDRAWTMALRGEPYDVEHRIVVGGEVRWVREKAELEFDPQGALLGGFGTVQDVTERRRAEEGLKALNETLEHRVVERTAVAEQRAAQLQLLASKLAQAEERERRRLAQILHEQLQQLLVAAKLKLSMLRRRLSDEKLAETADAVAQMVHQCIEESRCLTKQLSPPVLYDGGLMAGLDWLTRHMAETHGLSVEMHASPAAEPEDESTRILVFQAVRELLLNVVKHAQASSARVWLARLGNGHLQIVVSDAGIGFDPSGVQAGGRGFGLFSLRERLEMLGGYLRIDASPTQGTRVVAGLPTSRRHLALVSFAEGGQAVAEKRESGRSAAMVEDSRLVCQ